MQFEQAWVDLPAEGTSAKGFFVRPAAAKAPLPGVIVVQEVWGVDDHIQDLSHRLAAAGYAVLAPDLFATGGKPEALAPERVEEAKMFLDALPPPAWWDPAQRASALAAVPEAARARYEATFSHLLTRNRPFDLYQKALQASFAYLAGGPSQGRRIGATGFCMGGTLALRLASVEHRLAACVPFYGGTPAPEIVSAIRTPVLAHYGENDPNVNATIPALAEGLKAAGTSFEHHVYPGVGHAFFNDTRGSYRPDAARLAWARTLSFLAEKLS